MAIKKTFLLLVALSFILSVHGALPTYFSYSEEELSPLRQMTSPKEMMGSELKPWDHILDNLIEKAKLSDQSIRFFTYLYVAQRDAGYLSQNMHGHFQGSFDPVSYDIIRLFFPQFNYPIQSDPYSQALADLVLSKVRPRLEEDLAQTKPYPQKTGEEYWVGSSEPFYGQAIGSWKPWIIASANQFTTPPPPYQSPEWVNQLRQVKEASKHLTDKQWKAVLFWAGMAPGDMFKKAEWLDIANTYIAGHRLPLATALLVRSTLAMALTDTSIAAFDAKYTYWVKRPAMRDPSIKPNIDTPNHPSYPAGHATVSATAAIILTYFFPDSEELWMTMANEASQSRIWAGIHHPIDNQAGKNIGKGVARAAIEKVQNDRDSITSVRMPPVEKQQLN